MEIISLRLHILYPIRKCVKAMLQKYKFSGVNSTTSIKRHLEKHPLSRFKLFHQ
uniref:Uncharacterized protein n=1 Tax=Lepeophtheirus salmonis TaxID=72036 RepID=A0A0K2TYF9_LEPSM